jgi:hypothetical protein
MSNVDQPGGAASRPARLLTPEERESAIAQLSAAFARDVMTVEEYERRVTEVYRVTTPAALAELVSDLPGARPPAATQPPIRPAERAVEASPVIFSLFSNVTRAGRIIIPPRLNIQSIFGNVELDLRDAEFRVGVTDIEASAVFGNVEVLLPEGVSVENHGNAFLGNYAAYAPARPQGDQPSTHIRVSGLAVFGNVEFTVASKTAVRRRGGR